MFHTPRTRSGRTTRSRRLTAAMAAAVSLVAAVEAATPTTLTHAAPPSALVVTTTVDGAAGSLRAAITAANGDLVSTLDEIVLGAGTFVLDVTGNDDANAKGDLDILQPLTIRGAGSSETFIDAAALQDRVFNVRDGGQLTLVGVTVRGGVTNDSGGGVYVHNASTLEITDSVFRDNLSYGHGGAISTEGSIEITRSAFIDNKASDWGGAIRVEAVGSGTVGSITDAEFSGNSANSAGAVFGFGVSLDISNTTFSGNRADLGSAVVNDGGAILSRRWRLDHVTVAKNMSETPDGAMRVATNGQISMTDSIVAENPGGNCSAAYGGEFQTAGVNVIDDDGCGTDPAHIIRVAPGAAELEVLRDNGGPTRTHGLQFDSPAVHVTTCVAGTFDQRGVERPTTAGWCDAGAFEHSVIAKDDTRDVAMQKEQALQVLPNDRGAHPADFDATFADGSLTVATSPEHGTVRVEPFQIFYRSDIAYSGPDSLTYKICRGDECSTAVVAIDVQSFSPSQFVALTPQRILDTRVTGPKPAAGIATSLGVTGVGGVPTEGVTAVVLNVTATEADAPGYVKVYPSGLAEPTVSSLNLESAGQTIPNLVTVSVGAGGSIELLTQSGAHLVVDVAGYYRPNIDYSSGRFQPVEPARLLDTRADGSALAADTARDLMVAGAGGVPAHASAVVLNVTATNSLAAGYVTVWPAGLDRPVVSNLNVNRPGQTIPNLVIVPVGASGGVSIYSQSGADLVVDVTGWFTDGSAPDIQEGLFVPTQPVRVLDTRPDNALGGGDSVIAPAVDPATTATAVVLNVTATESVAPGYVTVWPAGSARPLASNVNIERSGQTIPNAAIIGVDALGQVELFAQSGTHLVVDVAGYFVRAFVTAP